MVIAFLGRLRTLHNHLESSAVDQDVALNAQETKPDTTIQQSIISKGIEMTLNIEKYARVPFFVDAVQVTEENMEEVAKWCDGTIMDFDETERVKTARHIKIKVFDAKNERQKKAFVGDYVLFAGKGFKSYNKPAFHRTFEAVFQNRSDAPLPGPRHDDAPRKPKVPVPGPRPQKTDPIPDEQVKKFQDSLHVKSEEEVLPGITATRVEEVEVKEPKTDVPQSPGEPVQLLRPQLGDPELAARGLPQSFEEGFKPVYTDGIDEDPNESFSDYIEREVKEEIAEAKDAVLQRGDTISHTPDISPEEAHAMAAQLAQDLADEQAPVVEPEITTPGPDDLCPLDGVRREDHTNLDHPFVEAPTS